LNSSVCHSCRNNALLLERLEVEARETRIALWADLTLDPAVGMVKAWSSEKTIGVDQGIKILYATRAVTTRKLRRHSLTERRFKKK